jgi:Fe-Mn family superoxide dismutase
MPALPYEYDALEPVLSSKAVELHYAGHLRGYVDKLNRIPAVANSDKKKLEELIIEGKRERSRNLLGVLPPGDHPSTLFNIAAQVYNHVFFFRSLSPKGGGEPEGDFADIVGNQYGSWSAFKKRLIAKGKSLFGSGWIWVCLDDEGQLIILKGLDAETPLVYRGLSPVLCIDVWEHAYYLDYNMDRGRYLERVVENLINWDFANKNLANA